MQTQIATLSYSFLRAAQRAKASNNKFTIKYIKKKIKNFAKPLEKNARSHKQNLRKHGPSRDIAFAAEALSVTL